MSLNFMITEEAKKEKLKLIKAEKKRFLQILKDLDENKKKAAQGLIDECAFMRATLKQLRDYIDSSGCIDEMQQGEYSILRESPAVRTYNVMIQKYASVCKQLFDMLPSKTAALIIDDGFDSFRAYKK